jgi:hypothetical protein
VEYSLDISDIFPGRGEVSYFFTTPRPAVNSSVAHPVCTRNKAVRDIKLVIHCCLVHRLRMVGDIPPLHFFMA